jgi:hypothetical protein
LRKISPASAGDAYRQRAPHLACAQDCDFHVFPWFMLINKALWKFLGVGNGKTTKMRLPLPKRNSRKLW